MLRGGMHRSFDGQHIDDREQIVEHGDHTVHAEPPSGHREGLGDDVAMGDQLAISQACE